MKVLSRDFTAREKALLVVLAVILLFALYYWGVDQPTRRTIAQAESEIASTQLELDVVNARAASMERMQSEIDALDMSESMMGSYNNSKAELDIINRTLDPMLSYSVSLASLTRSGDQVRRTFSLQFTTKDYSAVQRALEALAGSEYRCLIGDVRCTVTPRGGNAGEISVSANVTFYETMVGGTPDEALPADRAA